MNFATAERLTLLPPYLFAELDRMRDEVAAKGVDIIDLGVGDPDLAHSGPQFVIEALNQGTGPGRFAPTAILAYSGMSDLPRVEAAGWLRAPLRAEARSGQKESHHPNRLQGGPGPFPLRIRESRRSGADCPSPAYPVYAQLHHCWPAASRSIKCRFAQGKTTFLPGPGRHPGRCAGQRPGCWCSTTPTTPPARGLRTSTYLRPGGGIRQKARADSSSRTLAYTEMAYDGYQPPSILAG